MPRRALVLLALGVLLVVLAASISCRYPDGTCHPANVNGKIGSDFTPDPGCTGCLEDHCCDEVGRCEEEEGCSAAVANAHACVVNAGLRAGAFEHDCVASFEPGSRRYNMYGCMRTHCGESCALPVCQVNPAAVQFINPTCDKCVTSSCCDAINACYTSRSCKLAVDCITTECVSTLASDLRVAAAADLDKVTDAVCSTRGLGDLQDLTVLGSPCTLSCLSRYSVGVGEAPGVIAAATAGCLAFKVYACVARAGCADACQAEAGAAEAGVAEAGSTDSGGD